MRFYQLVVYVPSAYAARLKAALAAAGAGELGGYDSCFFECPGTGVFRPLPGSSPFTGSAGELTSVPEIRLETLVAEKSLAPVIAALRLNHPYETPAFHYFPVCID